MANDPDTMYNLRVVRGPAGFQLGQRERVTGVMPQVDFGKDPDNEELLMISTKRNDGTGIETTASVPFRMFFDAVDAMVQRESPSPAEAVEVDRELVAA